MKCISVWGIAKIDFKKYVFLNGIESVWKFKNNANAVVGTSLNFFQVAFSTA